MGRHEFAHARRNRSGVKRAVLSLALAAPVAAALVAAGGPAVAPRPVVLAADASVPAAELPSGTAVIRAQRASRSLRVVPAPEAALGRALPVGVAKEAGLQVKTILVERAVSAVFPEIHDIGGVRADALRWHPQGLAIDVMIPNPQSAAGIALGNQIVAYALANETRFGIDHVIWRDTMYMPSGVRHGAMGHYDHVHIATSGGGYPSGGEVYLR